MFDWLCKLKPFTMTTEEKVYLDNEEFFLKTSSDESEEDFIEDSDSESLDSFSNSDNHSDKESKDIRQSIEITSQDFSIKNTQSRVSKCGIHWSEIQPQATQRPSTVINFQPGPANFVRAASKKNAFSYFISDDILQEICDCTNYEANQIFKDKFEWENVEKEEMEAFIGLLLLAGVERNWDVPVQELFSGTDMNPFYRATMSLNRFKMIKRFLRFDDKRTHPVRKQQDKLAAFSYIWNLFRNNCRRCYIPSVNVTIDEQLVPVRGKCGVRRNASSKSGKSNIKIFWMCDSESSYAIDGIISCEQHSEEEPEKNLAYSICTQLGSSIENTERNITTSSFFTSIELAETLLRKRLTIVGAISQNKPEVPKCMKAARNRAVYSSVFGFYKDFTMVSYVPKKNKSVVLLSTMHRGTTVEEGKKKKPEIVMHYNATKGGVDTISEMARTYTCRCQIRRWSLALFMNCLDIAGINAYIIYTKQYPNYCVNKNDKRRMFLKDLAKELITPHLLTRSNTVYHPHIKEAIKLCGVQIFVPPPQQPIKRKRCAFCSCNKDRKTSIVCQNCSKPICGEHSYHLCQECV